MVGRVPVVNVVRITQEPARYCDTFNITCKQTNRLIFNFLFLAACPTCENFEEMQKLILELTYELTKVKQEVAMLKEINVIYESRVSNG